jgi:transcriptional repressor of cell division inhibition gene dicB
MDNTTQKRIADLVAHYGGQRLAATALGVSQPTVSAWLNGGHGISARKALAIEIKTGGLFKAVELCPYLDPASAA